MRTLWARRMAVGWCTECLDGGCGWRCGGCGVAVACNAMVPLIQGVPRTTLRRVRTKKVRFAGVFGWRLNVLRRLAGSR